MVKYQFNPIHGASDDKLSIIYYFTETIFIYFLIVLFIQSLHGFKKIFTQRPLRPYPSRQLARLTKGTRPSKKMRPVPQKTGCVHKRGEIPLSVMHMLVVT